MAQDPLAGLGVPATPPTEPTPSSATPTADPLATLGTPASTKTPQIDQLAASKPESSADQVVGDVATGFVKGVGDTVSGVAHLINKIPGVGETLSPAAGTAALDTLDTSKNTAQTIGKVGEGIAEFATGDEALEGLSKAHQLVSLAQKYPSIAHVLNMASQHPWLAKIITEGLKGATVGGVEGGVKGAQKDQAVKGAVTGAVTGGAVGAGVGAVAGAGPAIKNIKTNPFRKAAQSVQDTVQSLTAPPQAAGEAVSQPIAQAGVQASAPPVGQSLRSGIDINTPLAAAKTLYKTVDDAAKTDFKALYDKLDAAHDAAREAGIGTPEEARAELAIRNTQNAIDDAKKVAAQSGVANVDQTLAQADKKFGETQANKDFNKVFFGSPSVVEGNVAHGAPETIKIDGAIRVLENMDKPNRFGISRLQQTSLGPQGAFRLKQALYDAKKAGQKAMDARALRNLMLKVSGAAVGTALGVGYELTK